MFGRGMFLMLAAVLLLIKAGLSSASDISDSDSQTAKENAPPRWILETYAKKATAMAAETVMPGDVLFEQTDLNGDGHPDWIVYSTLFCGSAGCQADLYQFTASGYCYVGSSRYGDNPDALRNKYSDLECQKKDKQLKKTH